MQRDDSWIEEMLYFLNQFQRQFVALDCLPPSNFFWHSDNDEERARYRKFVDSTLELSSKVEVVARIPNHDIQRAGCDDAPLFLDEFKWEVGITSIASLKRREKKRSLVVSGWLI